MLKKGIKIIAVLLMFSLCSCSFASGVKESSSAKPTEQSSASSSNTDAVSSATMQNNGGNGGMPWMNGDFDPANMPEPPEGFDQTNMPQNGNFGAGRMESDSGDGINHAKDNVSTRNIISNEDDVYDRSNFKSGVSINLTDRTAAYTGKADAETVAVTYDDLGVTVASTLKDKIFIELTGSFNGTVNVSSTEKAYAVILNGVAITAKDGPALNLTSKKTAFVVAAEGTENVLTDTAERSANTKKASLYAKGPLILADASASGSGKITVNGGYKHGVYSDDYIRMTGGNIYINVSARDGLRCVNGFIMDDGVLNITGTGTATDEESKGIKVDGEESEKYAGEGFILINGGDIIINTVSKGITAGFKYTEDAETETFEDDPNPYVTINGGNIDITTTGKPYEYYVDGVKINCSPEGIESKTDLTINGGNIKIRTTDDGINAAVSITINGGIVDIVSSQNDGIDSNGGIIINGGTIYANGASGAETGIDCDMNPLVINGGNVFGLGGSNTTSPSSSGEACSIMYYTSFSKGTVIKITDSNGKVIGECTASQAGNSVLFSSSEIKKGQTYTLSCGSTSESVTISSNVTTVGNGGFGGGKGGFGGGRDFQGGDFNGGFGGGKDFQRGDFNNAQGKGAGKR